MCIRDRIYPTVKIELSFAAREEINNWDLTLYGLIDANENHSNNLCSAAGEYFHLCKNCQQ